MNKRIERTRGSPKVEESPPRPTPDFTMEDLWRELGWSDSEIQRESLLWHVGGLLDMHVMAAVASLQWRRGEGLVDLTWTEAFEAFFGVRCRELRLARKLLHQLGEKDWRMRWVIRGLKKLVRRAFKAYQAWLEEGRTGLNGVVLESYRGKVGGYWHDETDMRSSTTEGERQATKRLENRLDNDPDVVELRRRLRIPDDGFQDVDQTACWLYDRCPPKELISPHGPPPTIIGNGRPGLYEPAVLQVSVLAEAARRLRKKHVLDPELDFVLCFYLLRGELEPLPRKTRPRKRPMAERDAYLLDLMQRHSYRHTQIIYNSGLSEEEFLSIVEAHPRANDDDLENLCYEIATEKGYSCQDYISYDNLRKIKSRWG